MFVHDINPTIIDLGFFEIRWYGLMYVLGFFAVYYFGKKAIKEERLKISLKQLDDFLGVLVIAMIIGARLFYFLFYDLNALIQKPLEFFFIWQGGLSFHGGFFGILLAAYLFARKHSTSVWKLGDIFAAPLALGNAFGRIGNFINGEIYGIQTSLPWGVVFPSAEGARHPTQLYEAGYNLLIFGILMLA